MAHVEIKVGEFGGGSIVVDGRDLSNEVSGFTLSSDVNSDEPTRLVLNFLLFDTQNVSADAEVVVDDKTRDTLIALGWTPPS